MIIKWMVGYTRGPRLFKNPDYDIFDSYEDALAEAKNRGPNWAPFVHEPNDVIMKLLKENMMLRKENKQLRNALD